MALPICLEIPEIPDPLAITLPGGVTIQQINLMEAIQPALTPLMPIFDIIDTVVAVFNCVKAIPDSLGPPPDPTALAACIPELAEKVAKLLRLLPQLSLPYTIIGIIDLVIDTLRQARSQLVHLQQQMQQILGAIDRATELEDAGLMAITSCAQANVAQEAANVGKALASLGEADRPPQHLPRHGRRARGARPLDPRWPSPRRRPAAHRRDHRGPANRARRGPGALRT